MLERPTKQVTIERIPSGVPGLDAVTGGGFLRAGTYIVMGPPGAGKTILGNQICFHHVASGGRALYVTLLAESHARMLSHLRSMAFFDPEPLAASLIYVSGYRMLELEGFPGLLGQLRQLVRDHRATVLVLDGLVTAEAFAPNVLAFKKFIHELNAMVGVIGCTTFLLTNGPSKPIAPEHTMVDGLIELADTLVGSRAVRELVVRKFRGSAHLRGRHLFEISSAGCVVYPRVEALLAAPPAMPVPEGPPLSTGIEGLDRMLGGGYARGTTTLLLGATGSGKTTVGLHFLSRSTAADRGLYFGLSEPPPRLVAKGEALGLGLRARVEDGSLHLLWRPPVENLADALVEQLLSAVRQNGIARLFLDGLGELEAATIHPGRMSRLVAALANELGALGVTAVFSQETMELLGPIREEPIAGVSAVPANIVLLGRVVAGSAIRRVVSALKTRENPADPSIRELEIGERGVRIGAPLAAAGGLPAWNVAPVSASARLRSRLRRGRPSGGSGRRSRRGTP